MVRGYIKGKETLTHITYRSVMQRMFSVNHCRYASYGGAGLEVEPSWVGRGGYQNFVAHVGRRPSREYTLDRIKNDLGYILGNVRWATKKQQAENRRKPRHEWTAAEVAYSEAVEEAF